MDFNDKDTNNNDAWEWQDEELDCLERDSRTDFSESLWDNVNVNDNNLMCILDEQTPIKDCADLGYQAYDVGDWTLDNANKGLKECAETSQIKRRRMLQFTSDASELSIGDEDISSLCFQSKVDAQINGISKNLVWDPQWTTGLQDDSCNITFDGWNQPSEEWRAYSFNEGEMHCSVNEMPDYMAIDEETDVPEFLTLAPAQGTDAVARETPRPSPIKIIRGRKSFMESPLKLVTSVAYPFALVKPCGDEGDVTLKDINQRIHAPPPSAIMHKTDEDPSNSYPTSAFSGKPVVVKTKIRTEGGKGSITIMRTKGMPKLRSCRSSDHSDSSVSFHTLFLTNVRTFRKQNIVNQVH